MQLVMVIKDRDGNVVKCQKCDGKKERAYFEELMNEESKRVNAVEYVTVSDQEVAEISKAEVRRH